MINLFIFGLLFSFDLLDNLGSSTVDVVHCRCYACRGVAGELALVKERHETVGGLFGDTMLLHLVSRIVLGQLAEGECQLVAQIAPEGAHDLIEEGFALILLDKLGSLLETAARLLVGLAALDEADVGVIVGFLAEDEEEDYERRHGQNHKHPEEWREDEEIVASGERAGTVEVAEVGACVGDLLGTGAIERDGATL